MLQHHVLPSFVLGLMLSGVITRLVRVNVIQTLKSDYVEAARARGMHCEERVYARARDAKMRARPPTPLGSYCTIRFPCSLCRVCCNIRSGITPCPPASPCVLLYSIAPRAPTNLSVFHETEVSIVCHIIRTRS